jgi:peptidoglycan/LPS O-acetylase OafA/YrhL
VANREWTAGKPSHIEVLDGLRGIAILMVLAHHFALFGGYRPGTWLDTFTVALAGAGWAGVDLFFVLSGFLITRILLNADREQHYFLNFYARRTLRIFPLYYVTLGVFFVLTPFVAWHLGWIAPSMEEAYRAVIADQAWYWSYLVNVQIAYGGWPEFSALAHFWSLAIEEQFYLVWPLLVFFLARQNLLRVCVAFIVLSLAIRVLLVSNGEVLAAYVLAPARLDALAMGALLAIVGNNAGGWQPWRHAAWIAGGISAVSLGMIAVFYGGLCTTDAVTITVALTLLACFFASSIVLAIAAPQESILSRLLRSRALTLLGRYSYGIYVFHHPIAVAMGRFLRITDLAPIFGSQFLAFVLYLVLGSGVSIALAALSWHAFERHFLGLKGRFRGVAAPAAG